MNTENLSVLDREALLDRLGGDVDFLNEIAGLFMDDCPKLMDEIRNAVTEHDATALERSAHTLKGSVSNFGAERARLAALDLETMGRSHTLSNAEDAYKKLESEIDRFQQALGALAEELMSH
ncbi:MAG: Hpt domain-containing protein [Bryobacteraceae bacterium]